MPGRARRSSARAGRGGRACGFRRHRGPGNEDREVARKLRVEQVPGRDRVRRIRLERGCRPPRVFRPGLAGPVARDTEVELHGRALRVQPRELRQPGDGTVRPAAERLADPRLERVVAREELLGGRVLARRVEASASRRSTASGSMRTPRSSDSGGAPPRSAARPPQRRRLAARRGGDPGDGTADDEGEHGDDEDVGCERSRRNGSRDTGRCRCRPLSGEAATISPRP